MTSEEIARLRALCDELETSSSVWEIVDGERVFVGDGPNSPLAWDAAGELHEAAKHLPSALDEIERLRDVIRKAARELDSLIDFDPGDISNIRSELFAGLDPDAGAK